MYFLSVYNRRQHEQVHVGRGMIVVGTEPPTALDHLVIRDPLVGPWQLHLELTADCRLRISNQGQSEIRVGATEIGWGQDTTVSLPAFLVIGETRLVVFRVERALLGVAPLVLRNRQHRRARRPTQVEGDETASAAGITTRERPAAGCVAVSTVPTQFPAPAADTLASWFAALGRLQRLAASSPEFYQAAVESLVTPGGLDAGLLLVRHDGQWRIMASAIKQVPWGIGFDPAFAEYAYQRRETVYRAAAPADEACREGRLADAALAAPIFNEHQEVTGILYGTRCQNGVNRRLAIRDLEAQWIQLLAEAVTSGAVRLKHEADAARLHVLLEQAFPQEVVRRLSGQTQLDLPTEQREATIMFADLCDSSAICERLPPDRTYRLLADVLDAMTRVVMAHQGVIVDYYGDGLIAMWNAPLDQANHATLACETGLRILDEQRALNAIWSAELVAPLRLGIGIHTGTVLVGNSGSRLRIKYGPRGLCVNLANRVERATRYLGYPLLISEATRRRLAPGSAVRRLGRFRLWGFEEPESLYALHALGPGDPEHDWTPVLAHYEWTLRLIEQGRYAEALEQLDHAADGNLDEESISLLQRQLQQAMNSSSCFSGRSELVIDLTAAVE